MGLDYCAIGRRIKEHRTERGWTQEQLASAVGISNPHMSNIERGRTKVSLGTLTDIANALDTTLDALICDNLVRGRLIFEEEISKELKKCSQEDIRIIYDVIKTLVKSMAERKH